MTTLEEAVAFVYSVPGRSSREWLSSLGLPDCRWVTLHTIGSGVAFQGAWQYAAVTKEGTNLWPCTLIVLAAEALPEPPEALAALATRILAEGLVWVYRLSPGPQEYIRKAYEKQELENS